MYLFILLLNLNAGYSLLASQPYNFVHLITKVRELKLLYNKTASELRQDLRNQVLGLNSTEFEKTALQIFQYQAHYNPVYKEYLGYLNTPVEKVHKLSQIPFLPIQFFKNHNILTGEAQTPKITFESSGTTGLQTSRHSLYDEALYHEVSQSIFESHYGPLNQFHIFALLPSYLERSTSSLVYMMQHFIQKSDSKVSDFYLKNTDEMLQRLKYIADHPDGKKILLMGVTFALLDLAESGTDLSFIQKIPHIHIMDTGGMKGRREELLREEVHDILTHHFGVSKIHSEYGMTELLSQSYSQGDGLFFPKMTMQILLRDINDPFQLYTYGETAKTGGINVIDLANIDSCAFIETQDLGRFGTQDSSFYVMGRFDNSDIRGCSLMVI